MNFDFGFFLLVREDTNHGDGLFDWFVETRTKATKATVSSV